MHGAKTMLCWDTSLEASVPSFRWVILPFPPKPLSQHEAIGGLDALVVVRDGFLHIKSVLLSNGSLSSR